MNYIWFLKCHHAPHIARLESENFAVHRIAYSCVCGNILSGFGMACRCYAIMLYLLPAYASAYVCILIFFLLTVRCVNCGQVAMAVGRVEAASRNLEIIISLFLKRNLKNYKENLKI